MVKITFRIWIYILFMIIALIAIHPTFTTGVVIKSIEQNSSLAAAGISTGEIIRAINSVPIKNIQDYSAAVSGIDVSSFDFLVLTDNGMFNYSSKTIDFEIENLTITSVYGNALPAGLKIGLTIKKINDYEIKSDYDFYVAKNALEPKLKISIETNKQSYSVFINGPLDISVGTVPKTRIKTGLDLQGGARGLVKPERKLFANEMQDLLEVSRYRLNVYGISDVNVRTASDLSGNTYMLVEVAGATTAELKDLIGKQGKFEAKIGNETVFLGGKEDITSVCRNDAMCAGISACDEVQGGYSCKFQFVIYLSEKAAKKHADITSLLSVNATESGSENYLSKKLDLYLDDKLVDSLFISEDLQGKVTTQIQVQGGGSGATEKDAVLAAQKSMQKLQTVLITGSLPFKLEIVKLDSISPALGDEFMRGIFLAALAAVVSVFLVLYIRYRKLKISSLIFCTVASEIFMTIGLAALIRWNLDLPSIAGIIAAIGTGVDDQIVIVDESRTSSEHGWKERIKRAFTIIFGAYSTVVASLLPLGWAGAGLLKGFAITTLLGISIGVFVTRPAFADVLSQVEK
ncbi:MAG: MMPL family transporter [archaeon]